MTGGLRRIYEYYGRYWWRKGDGKLIYAGASKRGYYLKPVHKVYRTTGGLRRIYEYYGRYWWRKGDGKLIYAGAKKPGGLPQPPLNPLEGLSVIREGDDVIIRCDVYERFKWVFEGLAVERG